MTLMNELYEEVMKCTKCGFCQCKCITYLTTRDESYVARGRVQLVRALLEGKIDRSEYYKEYIDTCTTCRQCDPACPSGVKGDKVVLMARQDLYNKEGFKGIMKKVPLHYVLPSRGRKNRAFGALRMMKSFLPSSYKGVDVKGMPVASKPFVESTKEVHKPEGEPKYRVALFVGCFTDYTLPKVAEATVRFLQNNGVEVIVPKAQDCCGMPMFTYGDLETARNVASKTVDAVNKLDVDYVITICGSCGGNLKDNLTEFTFKGTSQEEDAKKFSEKVIDINEFLVDKLEIDYNQYGEMPIKVTYHDSCHLARGMGVTSQPRQILKNLPGVEYIEMKDADQCCGAAGLFQGSHPELANDITTAKITNAKNTGADYIAVDCPACLHRIQGAINLDKGTQKVAHISEIVDAAFQRLESLKLAR